MLIPKKCGETNAKEMPSQVDRLRPALVEWLFNLLLFLWSSRSDSPSIIDKHDLCALKVDDHVRLMIAINIDEAQCDRYQASIGPEEVRPKVDTHIGGILAVQLDDFNTIK